MESGWMTPMAQARFSCRRRHHQQFVIAPLALLAVPSNLPNPPGTVGGQVFMEWA